MARTQSTDEGQYTPPPAPPFNTSWRDWSDTKLSYPRELYKGEYYRLTGSQEDHYKLLREGWVDDKAEDHPYKPWSSNPDALVAAQRSQQRLREAAAAEAAKQTPQVTKDLVAEMIEKKLQEFTNS